MARARRRWIREQGLLDPARLVFIDETATSTNMVRLRGRCRRGVRLVGYAPHGHWKTITFVAGLRHDRMVARFVMEGAMNGLTFVEWVRQFLVPTLKRRDVVIMDNLPSHKVPGVREAIESAGATLRYLVTVGTSIAGGPPHSSVLAAFPHTAPTSGMRRQIAYRARDEGYAVWGDTCQSAASCWSR